ncbi:hypothetical protein [Corynebacterium lowii]|uniref:Uncharacterized protein n=1 Tax=Corynebacterium lowii TaxID=1544413 RepID=A0A0Q0U7N4_9CORY|nr:hypothetical protein [Corynebacterium lowii]KQB83420.1 hypothetical protein Clow_02302 [Corynebacterium lowii]MDP9850725.1 hypothetical protein [Corynebacterium lowii]
MKEDFSGLLESAAKLQTVITDAVLVGGTAAAIHAGHRFSQDHDHVVRDLKNRYRALDDALATMPGWKKSSRASRPPMTIMGTLDGFQAGLRNLRREKALEVEKVILPSGGTVVVPTLPETLRIKTYLVMSRNQVRDYLDVAALSNTFGITRSGDVLRELDDYYGADSTTGSPVLTETLALLFHPDPRDADVIDEIPGYKGIDPSWNWERVITVCKKIAEAAS